VHARGFIAVDLEGQKVAGPEKVRPVEGGLPPHRRLQGAPDIDAISHLHPPNCIVFAVRNRSIPLVTITAEVRLGPTPVVPEAPSDP
jgi:ribulose-5-phosphate 4-epimerase/fuculose-1-phosphate aldolase